MQLATSQRPHPPPVPPRPSRHVVAEALKRTPRPPCPTRQAPPPPNTRPWRLEDHETAAGRTVVYESARGEQQTNGEQVRCSSEPRSLNELQRPLASLRCCNDETLAYGSGNNITGNTAGVAEKTEERDGATDIRAASERNVDEKQRERHQQRQPLMKNRRSISDDNILAHNQTDYSQRKNDARSGGKYYEIREEETGGRVLDKFISRIGDEYSEISEQEDELLLNGCANEDITNLEQVKRTEIRNEDDGTSQRRSPTFVEKAYSQGEATAGTRLSTTPTKLEKKLNDNNHIVGGGKVAGVCKADEEAISREAEEAQTLSATDPSGSTTTISSDDGATVVVIEEPERKIAFNDDNDNIYHQDWLEAGIRYSSTKITLPGDDPFDRADEIASIDDNRANGDDERRTCTKLDRASIRERISMSSLQGLPPLPRSLSGFNLSEGRRESAEPPPPPTRSSSKTQKNVKSTQPSSSRPSPPGRQLTTLDTQLAILRKEMFGLRQLDLSLLSQLWSLNESIQEFRQLLQEQEDRAPSPSPSSEEGDDNSYGSHPPPPPRRPAPLLHHHRPPRPPRPLRPPANDESPSSEEYGAV